LDGFFENLGFIIAKNHSFNAEIVATTGFVWNESLICEKLDIIIKKLGKFPSINTLKHESSPLASAVSKFGGLSYFREIMGHPAKFNPFKGKTKEESGFR